MEVPKKEDGTFQEWHHEDMYILSVKKCPLHNDIEDGYLFYHVWIKEQQPKNYLYSYIKDNHTKNFTLAYDANNNNLILDNHDLTVNSTDDIHKYLMEECGKDCAVIIKNTDVLVNNTNND